MLLARRQLPGCRCLLLPLFRTLIAFLHVQVPWTDGTRPFFRRLFCPSCIKPPLFSRSARGLRKPPCLPNSFRFPSLCGDCDRCVDFEALGPPSSFFRLGFFFLTRLDFGVFFPMIPCSPFSKFVCTLVVRRSLCHSNV